MSYMKILKVIQKQKNKLFMRGPYGVTEDQKQQQIFKNAANRQRAPHTSVLLSNIKQQGHLSVHLQCTAAFGTFRLGGHCGIVAQLRHSKKALAKNPGFCMFSPHLSPKTQVWVNCSFYIGHWCECERERLFVSLC